MSKRDIDSIYLQDVVDGTHLYKIVNRLVRILCAENAPKFEAVAFCGMSGSIIASCVAAKMKKDLILVRKSDENRHSSFFIETPVNGIKNYIIIDDFISSGKTISFIIEQISTCYSSRKCVGIYLYNVERNDHMHMNDDSYALTVRCYVKNKIKVVGINACNLPEKMEKSLV